MNAGVNAAIIAANATEQGQERIALRHLKAKRALREADAIPLDKKPHAQGAALLEKMVEHALIGRTPDGRYWIKDKGLSKLKAGATSGGALLLVLLALAMIVASVVGLIVILD